MANSVDFVVETSVVVAVTVKSCVAVMKPVVLATLGHVFHPAIHCVDVLRLPLESCHEQQYVVAEMANYQMMNFHVVDGSFVQAELASSPQHLTKRSQNAMNVLMNFLLLISVLCVARKIVSCVPDCAV